MICQVIQDPVVEIGEHERVSLGLKKEINNFMDNKRKNTEYLKTEAHKVIFELNKVIEKLERRKKSRSSEKKRYNGL
jgi:hypothetical protein